MKEELVTFETAKLLKQKGFHELCLFWYYEDGQQGGGRIGKLSSYDSTCDENSGGGDQYGNKIICAPSQSLVQRWLREIHNLHLEAMPIRWATNNIECYTWTMRNFNKGGYFSAGDEYSTYEESLEEGIQKALGLI